MVFGNVSDILVCLFFFWIANGIGKFFLCDSHTSKSEAKMVTSLSSIWILEYIIEV